jgi:hypothetical protein
LLNSFISESLINISYINSLHITLSVSNYPSRSPVIQAHKRTQSSALNMHLRKMCRKLADKINSDSNLYPAPEYYAE